MSDGDITTGLNKASAAIDKQTVKLDKLVKKYDELAKAVYKTMGGTGTIGSGSGSGGPMMPGGTLANVSAPSGGSGMSGMANFARQMIPGVLSAGLTAGTGFAQGKLMGMPDVQATMNRATSYYNAGISMGVGGSGMRGMQSSTLAAMSGGLTAKGNDAMVSEYLGSRGMNYSADPNSTYMQTARGVGNAAKYLNMSNERSMTAIEGLTSGATSRSLLNNLGIYTSDTSTGKEKGQAQIFGEISNRLTAGRGNFSVEDVNDSFRRGNLGASLSGMGLSDDQQQMFKQFMIAKAQGKTMDLSSDAAMADLGKVSGLNPASMQYKSNTYDTQAMDAAQKNYIQAIQDVLPELKRLSDEAGKTADSLAGYAKSKYSFMQGNQAGAGEVFSQIAYAQAGGDLLSSAVGSAMNSFGGGGGYGGGGGGGGGRRGSNKLPKGLYEDENGRVRNSTTKQFAPDPRKGDNGSRYLATADQTPKGGAPKLGVGRQMLRGASKMGKAAGVAGAVIGGVTLIDDAMNGQGWGTKQFSQDMGSTIGGVAGGILGGAIGSLLPGAGTVIGGIVGGMAGSWLGGMIGGSMGQGGTNSTISGSQPTGSGAGNNLSFIMPVNGKISDGFGPRTPPVPGASSFHDGIDIAAPEGTPICASADGTVTVAGNKGSYGKYIEIKHPNGYITFYGHQSRFAIGVGAKVRQGQVIGYVGNTGASTGAHLHFGMHDEKGAKIDPMKVISGGAPSSMSGAEGSKGAVSGGGAAAKDINALIDTRAKQGAQQVAPISGAAGGMAGAAVPGSSGGGNNLMVGNSQKNNLSNSRMGIYLPGAPRAKQGDSYVAQDGPVNVHAGEAILTAQQADTWRKALQSGSLGKSGGNNVTINVTVQQASEAEAKRLAKMVKEYIDQDEMFSQMGGS